MFLLVSKFKVIGMVCILFLALEGSGEVGDSCIYLSFVVVVVVVPSFGNTEGTVEWDYYYGANASTESEAGPVDTKVKNGRDLLYYSRFSIIWLNPQAGKMKRIILSDWLPEQAKWACLARSRFFALVLQD